MGGRHTHIWEGGTHAYGREARTHYMQYVMDRAMSFGWYKSPTLFTGAVRMHAMHLMQTGAVRMHAMVTLVAFRPAGT